jgi:hypothetical protein
MSDRIRNLLRNRTNRPADRLSRQPCEDVLLRRERSCKWSRQCDLVYMNFVDEHIRSSLPENGLGSRRRPDIAV